jgi:hypothetical protein
MDAKAQGLEESSPRAISLQQIIVALNMVSKVTVIHKLHGCVIKLPLKCGLTL